MNILFKKYVRTLILSAFLGTAALGSLLVIEPVEAVTCPTLKTGDRFKSDLSPVISYLNKNGQRMYFPDSDVYGTWFIDYTGVITISDECVNQYPFGGGINYRPASRIIKAQPSPKIYAVVPGNKVREITTEEIAQTSYGMSWNERIWVVKDIFWNNYNIIEPLTTPTLIDGMMLTRNSIKDEVYYVWGGKLQQISGPLPQRLKQQVINVSQSLFNAVPKDTKYATAEIIMSDPAQLGGINITPPAPAQNTTVNVFSCVQVGKNIKIKRSTTDQESTLTTECRDAGYGLRYYTMSCNSSTQYKVVSKPCPTDLNVKDSLISVVTLSNVTSTPALNFVTAINYGEVSGYPWNPPEKLLPSGVTNIKVSFENYNLASAEQAVVISAKSTNNNTAFDLVEANNLLKTATFSGATSAQLNLNAYLGKWVTIYMYARNNDGVSAMPGTPVEADDLAVIRVYVPN